MGPLARSRRSLVAIAGIAVILPFLLSLPIVVAPRIKARLVNALGERFDSDVQLETLTVSLLPRPRLSGRGLVLRHKHRTDVPPLVAIASFSGDVPPGGMSLDDDTPDPVVSSFRGTFTMRDGAIHFPNVTFVMPGARVSVAGRFVMESEALDLRGVVRLDAKLSEQPKVGLDLGKAIKGG